VIKRRVLTGLLLAGAMLTVLGMAVQVPANAAAFVRIQ
jgi:hypothetical protein